MSNRRLIDARLKIRSHVNGFSALEQPSLGSISKRTRARDGTKDPEDGIAPLTCAAPALSCV